MYTQRAQRKIQLVLNHNQVRLRTRLVLPDQLSYRQPAQIHERLGLRQQHHLVREHRSCRERPALPVPDFHAQVLRDSINRQKPQVMRRELIFDSGIAETNNQFHARSESSNQAYFHPEANAFCPPKDPGEPCDASRSLRCIGPATGSLPYFFSFLSDFSEPASALSSSVSCLPFLITSGSAGP